MNHKYPDLNIRYAVGMGDLIASILHSKSLSWLVNLIKGNDKICVACSKRRYALNVLLPIKFWKLFFKNEDDYLQNLSDFYNSCGFNAIFDKQGRFVSVSDNKIENESEEIFQHQDESKIDNTIVKNPIKPNYMFLSSNEVILDDNLIRTEYYKKI